MGTLTKADVETKAVAVKVATKLAEGERTITAVVSSPNLDRDFEKVDVKSLRLPLKGGGYVVAKDLTGNENIDLPFLLNHSFDVEDVIGSARKAFLNSSDELVVEFGISKRLKAQDMMTLIEEGHLDNAFSITMSDYEFADNTFFNAETVEVSLVFRGSNKDARVLSFKSLLKGGESMATATEETKPETKSKEVVIDVAEPIVEVVEDTEVVAESEGVKEEANDEPAETEAEEEKTDEVEDEAEEVEPEATDEKSEEAEDEAEEVEVKSIKKEKKMTKAKEIAATQVVAKAPEVEQKSAPVEKIDKVDFAAKQFMAWLQKDTKTLTELNKKALESYGDSSVSKQTYMNAATTADGGAIVPEAQLLGDIYTTLANYSTVANDLRVVTLTSGDSLDVATLVADVVLAEVESEGGDKEATKPTLGDDNIALREFAGIAIFTKKLVRQAAVNVYDILRDSFARAIAKQRAELALTDADSGIVNKNGVVEVPQSGTEAEDITPADIKKMAYAIPASAVPGAKYYISREALAALDQATDQEGRDLDFVTLDGNGLSGRFKNGFQFAVEEILGDSSTHAVFGSMSRFGILLRQGTVEAETFDTGTVVDGSEVEHNLLQQNKLAHRVAFYENVGYPIPGAFAVLVDAVS